MDHQVKVDAVDLDIDFVCSEISWDNIFMKSVLRAAIDSIADIIDIMANVCVKYLDHLMLKELRNVVAKG